ncbi:MAG: glycosyltransferase family 92 protein [Selenomonadaceae bacterium]|nr:glycosyltransferase family 92 protein [Selenomonadaceae bacterium]
MTDKNLFFYELAIVAIFKDEARYLKEWIDYHLLAGVEHFYLYNNDSTDDYKEVLAPYVEENLVTLTEWSGRLKMYPAYDDAIEKYRFDCRYMVFIDIDEFIFPKTNQSIAEVADEIFSQDSQASALGINWQIFGSNNLETADYNRGVLERFTRRAPKDWIVILSEEEMVGNFTIKSLVNPRRVDCWWSPHYANYFRDFYSINSDGAKTLRIAGYPIATDKIVINHYVNKSREEFENKIKRGSPCRTVNHRDMELFSLHDRNDEFDDGILKYRDARSENFYLESYAERIRRVENNLVKILTQCSPFDVPDEFFIGKLETFLTCRALAEKLGTKIGNKTAEEYVLVWIYQILNANGVLTYADLQLFVDALPEILARPFPLVKKIGNIFSTKILPAMSDAAKNFQTWKAYKNLQFLQRLLNVV